MTADLNTNEGGLSLRWCEREPLGSQFRLLCDVSLRSGGPKTVVQSNEVIGIFLQPTGRHIFIAYLLAHLPPSNESSSEIQTNMIAELTLIQPGTNTTT